VYDKELSKVIALVRTHPGNTHNTLRKTVQKLRRESPPAPELPGIKSLRWKLHYLELRGDLKRDERDRWTAS
jgi:hypothetical protein